MADDVVRAPSGSTTAITLVTEPHVHPLLRCNVWLVQGRRATWSSTPRSGCGRCAASVEQHLDGPLLAVATHAHGDHVGGFHEFDQRAIHEAEADVVAEAGLTTLRHRLLPGRR